MPVNKRNLTSAGRSVSLSNTRVVKFFNYATDETLAEVTAAGYFNDVRADVSLNSIVHCVVDCDGTPNYATLRFTAVPATGDVTCAIDSPAA